MLHRHLESRFWKSMLCGSLVLRCTCTRSARCMGPTSTASPPLLFTPMPPSPNSISLSPPPPFTPSLLLLLPAGTHRYTWDPHNGGEARRLPDGEEFDAGGEVRGKEALVGW